MLKQLPIELVQMIKDFIWGTQKSWKNKFTSNLNYVLKTPNLLFVLKDVKSYKVNNQCIDCEDSLYCPFCGEKSMFFASTFYHETCDACEPFA